MKRQGKILRVKRGYNPNSSSIGSIVFSMSAKILALSGAFGAVAAVIYSAFLRPPRDRRSAETGTREPQEH